MASRANEMIADLGRCADGPCTGCLYENEEAGCADQLKREAAQMLQEYVDRCKRYADEIMALREKQQWISVTERLPAEGMRVLAASEGVFTGEAYLSCEGVWMRSYGVVWVSLVDMPVTHWMPLPYKPGVACDG